MTSSPFCEVERQHLQTHQSWGQTVGLHSHPHHLATLMIVLGTLWSNSVYFERWIYFFLKGRVWQGAEVMCAPRAGLTPLAKLLRVGSAGEQTSWHWRAVNVSRYGQCWCAQLRPHLWGTVLGTCRSKSPLLCLWEMLGRAVHNLCWGNVHVASLSEHLLVEAGLGFVRQPAWAWETALALWSFLPAHSGALGRHLVIPWLCLVQHTRTGLAGAVCDQNSTWLHREVSVLLFQHTSLCSSSAGTPCSLPTPILWGNNTLS